ICINVASGECFYSKKTGIFTGYINNIKLTLYDVLYVSEFKRNLISIDQLIK
ncbi:hypothetical protein BCR36DRAFT_234104, partial [Piromyces finnis]